MLTRIQIPHIECPALVALAVLAAQFHVDFGVALAGGAVRNAALGLPESDHDIIIFNFADSDVIGAIDVALDNAGYTLHTVDNSDDYAEARVWMVRQYRHDVYPELDVLLHPESKSVQDVLLKHDFNINNFCAVIDDVADSERQTAYYVGRVPQGILHRQPFQEEICPDRIRHIVSIADAAGWAVPPRYRE
jgi:hypothetical protein